MKTILEFTRKNMIRPTLVEVERTHLAERYGFALRVVPADITVEDAAQVIHFWSPAGCIVNNDQLPASLFTTLPTLFFHRKPPRLSRHTALLTYDEQGVAEAAAREILPLNLAAYAFVPSLSGDYWCTQRERHFRRILALNSQPLHAFSPSTAAYSKPSNYQSELSDWLAELPRPAGLFAACDRTAQDVLNICNHLRLRVPDDMVVVGVDNIEQICECTRPSLSSVTFDRLAFDRLAFSSLKQLISGSTSGSSPLVIPPAGVVRRASTMRFRRTDHAVIAALDLIRRNACSGLKAADVVKLFPCGRRMAEIRFRTATGHSILETIRETRREKAKEMTSVKKLLPRDTIAASCGYASWSSIHRLLQEPITRQS